MQIKNIWKWKLGILPLVVIFLISGCAPTATVGSPVAKGTAPSVPEGSGPEPAPSTTGESGRASIRPGWVLHLYAPAKEDRIRICRLGYEDGLKGEASHAPANVTFRLKGGGWVNFSPSLAETYYVCYQTAENGEAMPKEVPISPAFVAIEDPKFITRACCYYKKAKPLRYAVIDLKSQDPNDKGGYRALGFLLQRQEKSWRVLLPLPREKNNLVIPPAEWTEFHQFMPGIYAYSVVIKGKPRVILGLDYENMSSAIKKLISTAETFSIMLSRGYGVEVYTISKEKYPDL